jgi:hypothetical protein
MGPCDVDLSRLCIAGGPRDVEGVLEDVSTE